MKKIDNGFYHKPGSIVAANAVANIINMSHLNSYNRLLLCSSAQKQFVPLENPEPPRIDSIYTSGLVYDSTFNYTNDNDLTVVKRYDKYVMGRKTSFSILLLKDKENNLYTHIHNDFIPLADGFGFKNDGVGATVVEGDKIPAKTFIQKADLFASDGFCWGKNYYTMYNVSGHTLEDAVKISKKVQEETKLCKVSKMQFNLKSRDRLKNIYGDSKVYKPFPLVGDVVNDDDILLCVAPIDGNSQLITSPAVLNTIGHSDKPRFMNAGSKCLDITIYAPNEDVVVDTLMKSIYIECKKFFTDFINEVEELIMEHGFKPDFYTEYYMDFYKSLYMLGAGLRGSGDNVYSEDTYMLEMMMHKYAPIDIGQKCSGQHGNKGVVSEIDDLNIVEVNEIYDRGLFVTESGIEVDIVLNTAGVPNRSNMGAPAEKYTNNHMDGIMRYHKDPSRRDYNIFFNDFMYILKYAAPEEYDLLNEYVIDITHTKKEFVDCILENDFVIKTNPFPEECHHPMYKLNTAERLEEIYKYFIDREEYKGFIGKERIYIKDGDKLVPTNIHAEVSRMYFIFLKYTAEKKYGTRTLGSFGANGAPSKTTRKKDSETMYMETPIKLGIRDTVLITSMFREYDKLTLIKFMLSTDSEIVDTFSALLGQIGVEIEYAPDTIRDIRRLLQSELDAIDEELI